MGRDMGRGYRLTCGMGGEIRSRLAIGVGLAGSRMSIKRSFPYDRHLELPCVYPCM